MITEDYVSFETAKLLKEKGMDKSCFNHYVQKNNNDGTSEAVTVCTLQMAMKWLREVYNLFIEIQCYGYEADEKAYFEYSYVISGYVKFNTGIYTTFDAKSRFPSYEEVCEEAIKYCLENLI